MRHLHSSEYVPEDILGIVLDFIFQNEGGRGVRVATLYSYHKQSVRKRSNQPQAICQNRPICKSQATTDCL